MLGLSQSLCFFCLCLWNLHKEVVNRANQVGYMMYELMCSERVASFFENGLRACGDSRERNRVKFEGETSSEVCNSSF